MSGGRGYQFMNNLPPGCSESDIDDLYKDEDYCERCENEVDECECPEPDPPGLDDYLEHKNKVIY